MSMTESESESESFSSESRVQVPSLPNEPNPLPYQGRTNTTQETSPSTRHPSHQNQSNPNVFSVMTMTVTMFMSTSMTFHPMYLLTLSQDQKILPPHIHSTRDTEMRRAQRTQRKSPPSGTVSASIPNRRGGGLPCVCVCVCVCSRLKRIALVFRDPKVCCPISWISVEVVERARER